MKCSMGTISIHKARWGTISIHKVKGTDKDNAQGNGSKAGKWKLLAQLRAHRTCNAG